MPYIIKKVNDSINKHDNSMIHIIASYYVPKHRTVELVNKVDK